ncbi:MAG: OmpH family outer membrane protein [Planctomycetes bacterium]|nr:OmpH family outer membrane protein [Planctomycetota bacterium]
MVRYARLMMAIVLLAPAQALFAEANVAVVNIGEVSEKYQKTADLEAQFDAKRKKLSDERDALRDRIERLTRSLKEEFKPGTDEFRERRKELAMLEAQLQYFIDSESKQVEQELADSLRSIFDDVQAVIREVAKEKGVDVVLAADRMPDASGENPTQVRQTIVLQKVLYWSPRVDLTADVVARLNAKYKAPAGK